MNRGYDDNKMFLKLDELGQDYVIRLKSNRKLFHHNKRTPAPQLRNRRKGKVKTSVFYRYYPYSTNILFQMENRRIFQL